MQEYSLREINLKYDIDLILDIEKDCFPEYPWDINDFKLLQFNRKLKSHLIDVDGDIRGYIIFEKKFNSIQILNFAVSRCYHKMGYGKIMINKVLQNLNKKDCDSVFLYVIETNVGAQLFLQKCGFIAKSILRNYCNTSNDAYFMVKEAQK